MTQTTYDPRNDRGSAAEDGWTSDRWADPRTVAAPWGPSLADLPPPVVVQPAPAASRRGNPWIALAIVLLAVLVGIVATRLLAGAEPTAARVQPSASAPAVPTPSAPAPVPSGDPLDPNAAAPGPGPQGSGSTTSDLSEAAAKVAPSIVNIATSVGYDGGQAAGTGVILTADGYVLTNHHVISGSTAIEVTVPTTGQTFTAEVVGYDSSHDIAVIKLRDASGLSPAPIGDSSVVQVGDPVVGLGNAGGLGGQPIEAAGEVTALDRSITATDSSNGTSERLSGLIETDADIEAGDSGGALIDAEGRVIGIITAGSVSPSRSGDVITDGYAVPINQAMEIAQDIRDGRASGTIHIGATAFLGVQVSGTSAAGVVLRGVVDDSAAERAGLAAGDTITRIDGQRISSPGELKAALAPLHPGDSVSLTWIDAGGRQQTQDIALGEGPVG
jgi:S1-C subfamily serine protease